MNNKQSIDLNNKTILITGSPGFIGAQLVKHLLCDNSPMKNGRIVSFDNMNDYYDLNAIRNAIPNVKKVKASRTKNEATFITEDNVDEKLLKETIDKTGYTCVSVSSESYKKKGTFYNGIAIAFGQCYTD